MAQSKYSWNIKNVVNSFVNQIILKPTVLYISSNKIDAELDNSTKSTTLDTTWT